MHNVPLSRDGKWGDTMPAESGEPKDIRFSIRLIELDWLEADTESKLQKFCEAHRMTRAEAIRKGIHLLLAEDK